LKILVIRNTLITNRKGAEDAERRGRELKKGSWWQPTISVYQLVDGEYQVNQFRGNQRIESMAFPELTLTAEQIFKAEL
jgi:Uma2 family endonuclease